MPRRLKKRNRETGYMYFKVDEVTMNMSLDNILKIVFGRCEEYRRIAKTILEGIKEIAYNKNRDTLTINSEEMSELIREKIGSKKKSLTYRVVSEFLIPLGFISYKQEEGTYTISRGFRNALVKIGTSYVKWIRR